MTSDQKHVLQYLLAESYRHGFEGAHSLVPVAKELGLIPKELYDNETNTGILWELGRHGRGYLDVAKDGTYASINVDLRREIEIVSDFR